MVPRSRLGPKLAFMAVQLGPLRQSLYRLDVSKVRQITKVITSPAHMVSYQLQCKLLQAIRSRCFSQRRAWAVYRSHSTQMEGAFWSVLPTLHRCGKLVSPTSNLMASLVPWLLVISSEDLRRAKLFKMQTVSEDSLALWAKCHRTELQLVLVMCKTF